MMASGARAEGFCATESEARETPSDETRWYAVHCQPHREHGAAVHLANQSFDVFLPYREKTRRHARRIDTVRAPYFPGYLFVALDLTRQRWRCINSTYGVVKLVSNNDKPSPAPFGVIEGLRNVCSPDGVVVWRPQLQLGQKVRVLIGPFTDFVGELDHLTDAGRVSVLLDLMGGKIPVFLPHSHVAPADSCL